MSSDTTAIVFLGVSSLAPWALVAAGKLRTAAPRRSRRTGQTPQASAPPVVEQTLRGDASQFLAAIDTAQAGLAAVAQHNGILTEADLDALAAHAYEVWQAHDGNASEAAKSLGLARTTFRGRVTRHMMNLGRAS